MRKSLLLSLALLFAASMAFAQDRTVSGKVTSSDDGSGVPGVNVVVKGTTTGAVTDIDGNYKLTVPADGGTLIFSFIGLQTQEVEIGSRSVIDVAMASDAEQLSEVVVTALGISREKASLGYAVTTVGNDALTKKPEGDVGRILRGKVAGVNITSTSGLAGSGTNILIRGYSSITGNNQPLFVVDGIPFNTSTSSDRGFSSGGATASSRFLDLDPNNIENISILKGLSATVLYGEQGRNGVVLVTTKNGKGSSNKKMEISVTQANFASQIASLPDVQSKYGNGWQNFASAAFSNWGAPFDQPGKNGTNVLSTDPNIASIKHPYDRSALYDVFPEKRGAEYYYIPYNNYGTVFGTGIVNQTSVQVSNNINPETSVNFGYSYLRDQGFIDTNVLAKHNFNLGAKTKLANGLTATSSFNYITSDRDTPAAAPIYSSNPISGSSLFSNVMYTPRSISLAQLEFENPITHESLYYRSNNGMQHPLWTKKYVNDNEKISRFFGSINLNYEITDYFNISYNLGIDTYTQKKEYQVNKGGPQDMDGRLETSVRNNFISNQTLNFNFNFDLTSDLNLNAIVGTSLRNDHNNYTWAQGTKQFIFGLMTQQNFANHNGFSAIDDQSWLGAYANLSFGYKDFLYLNLSGRNDWVSNLEKGNNSLFYPSVSASWLPLESFAISNDMVNHLKVRVGYGTSAGFGDTYNTRNVLDTNPKAFVSADGTEVQTNAVSDKFGNKDLKPEIHKELEAGLEGRFFNDILGIDFSWYNKNSEELIIDLQLDPSTGFTTSTLNTASMNNTGIEVAANLTAYQNNDWNIAIGANFTKNVSEITKLADGIDQMPIAGFSFLGNYAIPGRPYGVIWGSRILRTDAGDPIISTAGTYQQDPENGVIGDPNPDFLLNGNLTVSYKWLELRAQIDYTAGGYIWGSTASTLTGRGILEETGFDRFVPVVTTGVVQTGTESDGTPIYAPNDQQITANRHYWEHTGVFYDENRIYDASVVRLREVSLSITAPKAWIENSPFGNVSLTISGQNMWYNAFNFPETSNFDPEVLSLGVGNGRGFDYVTGPTSKRYGATLNLTF